MGVDGISPGAPETGMKREEPCSETDVLRRNGIWAFGCCQISLDKTFIFWRIMNLQRCGGSNFKIV